VRNRSGEGVETVVFRVTGGLDREVGALAARQKGQVKRRQLLALGLGAGAIDDRIARGRLLPRHRGVYAVGHLALPPFADEMAAVLALGEGVFVSHESGAAVSGIRCPAAGPEIDVTVAGRKLRSRDGIRVHCVAEIDSRDVRVCDDIPVTSPARTLVDLAAALTGRDLERAVDTAIVEHRVTQAGLRSAMERAPGRRGHARLEALLAPGRKTTMTRSEAEERMLALIRRAELPMPGVNAPLGRYVIDFLWRGHGLAVEVDGYQYHSTRPRFESDRRKDAYLQSVGIRPLRVTREQLKHEPEVVLVRLVRALGPC
jgi:very-short-patch-repair endonuclease